jgi:Co/Zn/Cd efflux system component
MNKTTFKVSGMDCPSEEQMIRMKFNGFVSVKRLEFNLSKRILTIYHEGDVQKVSEALSSLSMGSELIGTERAEATCEASDEKDQKKLLIIVLLINLGMFIVELVTGYLANSIGLVGDSLDMLADATVYGLSLLAVGGLIARKKQVAKVSGYSQILLAIFGFSEVIKRFLGVGELPTFQLMIGISVLALIGNSISLYLLQAHRKGDVHMRATWICTSNDVLVNIGVILAGVLVYLTGSKIPDLIIGTVAFALVGRASFQILKIAR